MIALGRLLQREGFGSRRECRRLVESGRVFVEGAECSDPERPVQEDGTRLIVDGVGWVSRTRAVLMLNKPADCECSRSPTHYPSVLSLLPPQLSLRGVQPVGRLDADTTGLLLLTDDGALNHRLTSPKQEVAKRYVVTLKHEATPELVARLTEGVVLRDAPDSVAATELALDSPRRLVMTIHEGRYHQVKRMVAAAGNRVEQLQRVAIGALTLPDDLPVAAWRWLDDEELAAIDEGR